MISLVYVGRVVRRQKRFDRVVDIALAAARSGVDLRISVFGQCSAGFELLPPSIIIHGFQDCWTLDVPREDILLFTSDYEGLPLSLLDFHKRQGCRVLAFRAAWSEDLFPDSNLFSETCEAILKLKNPRSLCYDRNILDKYFDRARFSRSVSLTKSSIEI